MDLSKRNLFIVGGVIVVLILGIVLLGKRKTTNTTNQTKTTVTPTESKDFEVISEKEKEQRVTPIVKPETQSITVKPTLKIPTATPTLIPTTIPTRKPTPTSQPVYDYDETENWDEEPTPKPTRKLTPTPDRSIKATGVSLNLTEINLEINEERRILAKVEPDNTTNKTVTWSSENGNIASVDNDGWITGIRKGTVTITARTSNNMTNRVKVYVDTNPTNTPIPEPTSVPATINPEGMTLNYTNLNLKINDKKQIRANIIPMGVTNWSVTWSSSNANVATINSNGLVTAKKSGTATITAKTVNNITKTVSITVLSNVTPTATNTPTPIPPTNTPTPIISNPISPPTGANLIFNETSNTLKTSIEDVNNGEYYVARMWIKDPFNQFKKAVKPSDWGTSSVLKYVYKRMNDEVTVKSLTNKMVIAINASAFWGDREATTGYYSLNKPKTSAMNSVYKKSPDGTIVINDGVIARNRPQDYSWLGESIFAINKSGNLKSYSISGNTLEKRQQQHQTIIDDGVKNTFAFNITLVSNGQSRLADGTCVWCKEKRARQVWCQIDKNNFMFITYVKEGGKNLIEVAQLAQDLGCKTAVNLDGGGSAQIAYKKAGQSTFGYKRTIRPVGDALYVTE